MDELLSNGDISVRTQTLAPLISVGICTRDRTDLLRLAIESLQQQDYSNFEIVVVDNCPSTVDTRKLAEELPVRYSVEPQPGHSWARNKLIAEARGEILAFLDDDMVVPHDWLSAIAKGFADPSVMSVTGLVLPLELVTPAQIIFERGCGGYSNGTEALRFGPGIPWKNGLYNLCHDVGPMMAFRKEIFDRVGLFDIALGSPVGGAEDIDMLHRVARTGCTMVYLPEAIRYHRHRRDYDGLKRQIHGYGKAYMALLTKCYMLEPDQRRAILRRVVGYGFFGIAKPLLLSLVGHAPRPVDLILTEGFGAIAGPWAYRRSVRAVQAAVPSYNPSVLVTCK